MKTLKCEICEKEYEQEIIYSYELGKIACIPCIKAHSHPARDKPEEYKVNTIINGSECPKIPNPIDKDILTKYKWNI